VGLVGPPDTERKDADVEQNLGLSWLLAQHSLDLPPAAFRRLIQSVEQPSDLLTSFICSGVLNGSQLTKLEQALASVSLRQDLCERLAAANAAVLCWHDAAYPELLKEIHDPPALLYYRGNTALLNKPLIAVVGSRRPSRMGQDDAHAFAKALSLVGFTIVSGLALGVDAAAHKGGLNGGAATVAVLGTGVDLCYPRSNQQLYQDIGQQGLLLSEYPLGSPPLRHQFPRRNRLISGMSLGVLVVEAAIHSGSLITARQALEQNREVFAMPGSIHNPASRGCNLLIKQGAKLVDCLDDIVEEFSGWLSPHAVGAIETADDQSQAAAKNPAPAVYAMLGYQPLGIDELAQHTGMAVAELMSALSNMEVDGWVEQRQGGWQRSR
jgi:DNA processing protein